MSTSLIATLCILNFTASVLLVFIVKQYALKLGLLAIPEKRSNHKIATPHGGGLAIAMVTLCDLLWLVKTQNLPPSYLWFMIPLLLVVGLGLFDDIKNITPYVRLIVQFLIVGGLLYLLSPLPGLEILGFRLEGSLWLAFLLLAGLWWINLFNFMDGLDGLASMQAIFMLSSALLLMLFSGDSHSHPVLVWILLIICAVFGFLVWNWQPAKIFMGDTGSLFLGLLILLIALISIKQAWLNYATWLILGATFITETTVTLLIRISRGHDILKAHTLHMHTILERRWVFHQRVVLFYLAINLVWLFPWSWYASIAQNFGQFISVLIAYTPLVLAVFIFHTKWKHIHDS